MNIDEDQINSMKRGDFQALGEEFSNLLVLYDSSDQKLIQLENILRKYASKSEKHKNNNLNKSQNNDIDSDQNNESNFWIALLEREFLPVMFEVLYFMLLEKEFSVENHGIILYLILLRMERFSNICNPILFRMEIM